MGVTSVDSKLTNVFDAMQLNEAHRLNQAKTEGLTILQKQLIEQAATIARLNNELQQAKAEIEDYEYLLCKPMHEIAKINGNFREMYEEQQTIIADWMVSQKGFKELAIQFGFEKGLTTEETLKMGVEKEIDVLQDKHDPEHKTNAGNSIVIGQRKEKLIKKRLEKNKNI